MRKIVFGFSLFLIAGIYASCSTDVELNAPYKSTTVVFGLLDPAADTQWIKINKTYLGEGNNLEYAQIRDSSEYDFSEFKKIVVQEVVNGEVITEHPLSEKQIANKEVNGIFYAPEQTVYYFPTPLVAGEPYLNQSATYRLLIEFHNRPTVTAETNIVRTENVTFVQPQGNTTISMATNQGNNNVAYNENVTIKWTAGGNIDLYDVTLRFHYSEVLNGVTTPRSLDYRVGSITNEDFNEGSNVSVVFSGLSFFNYLSSNIDIIEGIQRPIGYYDGDRTRCFDILISVGNEELNTYFEVNSPVTGVIQERPTYTNVRMGDEDAIGLFASRSTIRLENVALSSSGAGGSPQIGNLVALVYGQYTDALNFCDPNPNNGDYSCD